MDRFDLRKSVLTFSAVLAVLTIVGTSHAWAGSSSVGTQNPSFPVRTTVNTTSSQSGQILTIAATVVNKSGTAASVYVSLELVWPDGTVRDFSAQPSLAAGQSQTLRQRFNMSKGGFPAGQYTVYGIASVSNNPCRRSEAAVTVPLP